MSDCDHQPFVYVLILNWNGWQDTIECLESVFRSDYTSFRVIVCDNGSEDGSLERIKAWAEGRVGIEIAEDNPHRHLSFPSISKPVPYVEYDRLGAESGGRQSDHEAKLALIQTGDNLGFAGGNNVGLRYALSRDDFDFVWLLNNDTVVKPDTLREMVRRMAVRPSAGICGSTLMYYDQPDRIHALGGAGYSRWLGVPRRIEASPGSITLDPETIEEKMAYVIGASMLVSKSFLKDVGLMCEDYFLCFEELDWATRAHGKYDLAYAPMSIVFHKDGRSIGQPEDPFRRSLTADYYNIGNRLVFTRKHYPWTLPTVYVGLLVTLVKKAIRREWDRVGMILKLMLLGGPKVRLRKKPAICTEIEHDIREQCNNIVP